MGKPSRKKQEKKLRKQRKERAKRAAHTGVVAYQGGKYHTEELVPLHLATETGILQAFAATHRAATDRDVAAALEDLVLRLRHGELTEIDLPNEIHYTRGDENALLVEMILLNWREFFLMESRHQRPQPSRDILIGVLRSILGSIEIRTTAGAQSQGYLEYLEEFLAELGVFAEAVPADENEEDSDEDSDEDWESESDDATPFRWLPPR